MEVNDLRQEIDKCLQQAYQYGNIGHTKKYRDDINTLDSIMASYFGMYYNKELGKYE